MTRLRTTALPGGVDLPVLGQGTWRMGENAKSRKTEVDALRTGIELGMTLIDTAEMYADGGAEEVVGEAIKGQRDQVFIVSKFYPQNASPEKMRTACERSLKRLGTDRIDLYLLHWRGSVPLARTLEGFERLHADGKIRHAGVSNFDVEDMEELARLVGFDTIVANQVLYNLVRRGAQYDLLPWLRQRHRTTLAYSPIEEGRLTDARHHALSEVAKRHEATTSQVALAWVIRKDGVVAIPKSANAAHMRENRGAADLALTRGDLDELDVAFPAPSEPVPLETR